MSMKAEVSDQLIARIRRNLVEFGYNDLTIEDVREQVEKARAGEEVTVIGMMARTMLEENKVW